MGFLQTLMLLYIFSNNYVIQNFVQDGRIRSKQLKCTISHIVRDTRRKTKRTSTGAVSMMEF